MLLRSSFIAVIITSTSINAFYLPGSAPQDYIRGDRVSVLVNSVTPQLAPGSTQLKSLISYDYYDPLFGFCKPKDEPKKQAEVLGSILFGDRLFDSPFEITMLKNVSCAKLCTTKISPESSSFLSDRIRESYALNWLIDGLPAAEMKQDAKTGEIFYSMGFSLGQAIETKIAQDQERRDEDYEIQLNNHYQIYLDYHERTDGKLRIVGVVVWPTSIDSLRDGGSEPSCETKAPYTISSTTKDIAFTYDVKWRQSKTPWATRWDMYLRVSNPRIHLLSLINSIVIAIFLCIMVGIILLRTVHSDISRYNAIDLSEDVQEDFGWKLIHGEVFRPPKKRMLLSVAVGSGAQLTAMAVVTLIFALLGLLSPSNRGSLSTVMIVCWTLFGIIAGYVSSRLYATLKGEEVKKNTLYTAVLFPTFLFGAISLLNFFLIGVGSSGALPFGTILAVLALWLLINIPLTLTGSYLAMKRGGLPHPVRVNQIPRQIPKTEWYLKPWPSALIAGILPFGAAFIEFYFILQSLVASKAYYAFGFLALTTAVVSLTTATVTVLMCYFHLCAEEYRWHWRAFMTGGGSAIWLFAYGLVYWATRLHLEGFVNKVLYLGYLSLVAIIAFMVTGSIGFLSCYAFLRVIYSRIRVD